MRAIFNGGEVVEGGSDPEMEEAMTRRGALLSLLLAGALWAEDPPAKSPPEEKPEEIAARVNVGPGRTWNGMKPGTWMEMKEVTKRAGRETVAIRRQTLKSKDESVLKFEMRTWMVEDGEKVGDPKVTETMLQASGAGACQDVKELEPEKLEVDGHPIECRVVVSTIVLKLGDGKGTEVPTKQTVWYSAKMKYASGVVKTIQENEKPAPAVLTCTLKAIDIELTVSGKKVNCARIEIDMKGSLEGEVETHLSPDVPGGIVRTHSKQSWMQGNRKIETETTKEMLDYHVEP